jgi:hypothetical protein
VWGRGLTTFGEVTIDSAQYCAKYITKKITGKKALEHYGEKHPEFVRMSLKPGLGSEAWALYKNDWKAIDGCTWPGKNFKTKLPRYYEKLWAEEDPEEFAEVKLLRKEKLDDTNWLDQAKILQKRDEAVSYRLKREHRDLEIGNPEL